MIRSLFWTVPWLCVQTATADSAVRNHDIEPEDYFSIGVITSCEPSPDGGRVAYTELRWEPPAETRNLDLWVADCESREVRRLTFDRASDGSPAWSADGRYVYFTSKRKRAGEEAPPYNDQTQVWRITSEGGVPQAVTRVEDGVGLYELSKDGRTLYYTTTEESFGEEFKKLRKKYKKLEYGHGVTDFSQVWKLDLESWRAEKVVDKKRVIRFLAVSPDERRIAMITTPDDKLLTNEGWSRVDVYDCDTESVTIVTTNGWRADHPSPYGWVEGVTWAADGQALAFSVSFDGYPTELYTAEWTGDRFGMRRLQRPDGVQVADGAALQWRGGTRELCFVGEWRARKRVYGLRDVQHGGQGQARELTPGDVVVDSFGFSRSGDDLAAVLSTTVHPPDVYHATVEESAGDLERITRVNPQVDTWKLPSIEIFAWTAPDGTPCEGILELPPGYQHDKPLPMIVEVHGGPTAATYYRLRYWIYGRTLMPAKGYALFSPNYRGSTGYGDKFTTDLVGHENDVEVKDILAGVDALVDAGIADVERLGVMGWSNGGFLTNCLISRTDRFKAASSGAGILDMVIQWGSEDTPGHVVNFMQGLPWQVPDAYEKASPVYHLGNVRTPTIIHVGGDDARCPPAHSRGLYRALRRYLDVPVELVIYPGEGHGLRQYEHRKAKMEWDIAWFDKYLLGKTDDAADEENEK
jgi:dipeptidyl aminopeptidase/acylaminoacyl peptidase